MSKFPLNGVIGIVANDPGELNQALDRHLSCVEIRADLLVKAGSTIGDVFDLVEKSSEAGLGCLFTLRHPDHGGQFSGTEDDRMEINRSALKAGADVVDLEWGYDATSAMLEQGVPMVVSHHDFEEMIAQDELDELTSQIEAAQPAAIKVVPTAATLSDATRMLNWVRGSSDNTRRIGFAMGSRGGFSRILTLARGSPITYASFGEAVAPGQVSLDALLNGFRVTESSETKRIFALAGENASHSPAIEEVNDYLSGRDAVCIPLETSDLDDLLGVLADLRIVGVRIEGELAGAASERFTADPDETNSVYLEVSSGGDPCVVANGLDTWLDLKGT